MISALGLNPGSITIEELEAQYTKNLSIMQLVDRKSPESYPTYYHINASCFHLDYEDGTTGPEMSRQFSFSAWNRKGLKSFDLVLENGTKLYHQSFTGFETLNVVLDYGEAQVRMVVNDSNIPSDLRSPNSRQYLFGVLSWPKAGRSLRLIATDRFGSVATVEVSLAVLKSKCPPLEVAP